VRWPWFYQNPSSFLFNNGTAEQTLVLTPVILATQEAEIRRIVVQSQPQQIVLKI
jgi:hypothetical protein